MKKIIATNDMQEISLEDETDIPNRKRSSATETPSFKNHQLLKNIQNTPDEIKIIKGSIHEMFGNDYSNYLIENSSYLADLKEKGIWSRISYHLQQGVDRNLCSSTFSKRHINEIGLDTPLRGLFLFADSFIYVTASSVFKKSLSEPNGIIMKLADLKDNINTLSSGPDHIVIGTENNKLYIIQNSLDRATLISQGLSLLETPLTLSNEIDLVSISNKKYVITKGNKFFIYDLPSKKLVHEGTLLENDIISCVSSFENMITFGTRSGKIFIYDYCFGEPNSYQIQSYKSNTPITHIKIDQLYCVTTSGTDVTIRKLSDIEESSSSKITTFGHFHNITDIQIIKRVGGEKVVGTNANSFKFWNIETGAGLGCIKESGMPFISGNRFEMISGLSTHSLSILQFTCEEKKKPSISMNSKWLKNLMAVPKSFLYK